MRLCGVGDVFVVDDVDDVEGVFVGAGDCISHHAILKHIKAAECDVVNTKAMDSASFPFGAHKQKSLFIKQAYAKKNREKCGKTSSFRK